MAVTRTACDRDIYSHSTIVSFQYRESQDRWVTVGNGGISNALPSPGTPVDCTHKLPGCINGEWRVMIMVSGEAPKGDAIPDREAFSVVLPERPSDTVVSPQLRSE